MSSGTDDVNKNTKTIAYFGKDKKKRLRRKTTTKRTKEKAKKKKSKEPSLWEMIRVIVGFSPKS